MLVSSISMTEKERAAAVERARRRIALCKEGKDYILEEDEKMAEQKRAKALGRLAVQRLATGAVSGAVGSSAGFAVETAMRVLGVGAGAPSIATLWARIGVCVLGGAVSSWAASQVRKEVQPLVDAIFAEKVDPEGVLTEEDYEDGRD